MPADQDNPEPPPQPDFSAGQSTHAPAVGESSAKSPARTPWALTTAMKWAARVLMGLRFVS